MEEPLEQERSMTSDDLKPTSSSTTTKSTRSNKQTSNGTKSRHKRRRPTNSARSFSDHSTSSSRSSSSTSSHSSRSSVKQSLPTDQQTKKTRSVLAQEHLQTVIDKTKTGQYDVIDGFAFLSFEIDEDWHIAYDHFHQQHMQKTLTNRKSSHLVTRKNGHSTDQNETHSLNRSISMPCKVEDGQRNHSISNAAIPDAETTTESHRMSGWSNRSPTKSASDFQSNNTIKSESIDRTNRSNRTTSEHDDTQHGHHNHDRSSPCTNGSSQKSNDDKNDVHDKKHHHHHHNFHKRHKIKHDLSINGDSSNKHPTITSMSDLTRQQIKNEPISIPPPFQFPPHFDPKLFPLHTYPSFASAGTHPSGASFPSPYDPALMLAGRLYGGPYPRDLSLMPPPLQPGRPPSRSLCHPFSIKDNHSDPSTSMEKMLEKLYPGVLPSYLAAATSAAAASANSSSPISSLNVRMHGASPNGSDHSLWSHRENYPRQYLNSSTKQSSIKSPLFENNSKPLPNNHPVQSPVDRRQSSSHSTNESSNGSNPSAGHPLYLAPVIVTEFHQHQHNHNHTHEHKLNITTKDDRQPSASPTRSRTPLSNETKKSKSSFSVTDMFIDKSNPIKHSPQAHQQGFLSVTNKKETNTNNGATVSSLKKAFNGKWSTAHIQIARMVHLHDQRQRDRSNSSHSTNKIRPTPSFIPTTSLSSSSTLLPPPLPVLDNANDLGGLRPPPFPIPFDVNMSQYPLFRPPSSTLKLPRPIVTSNSSSSLKTPTTIKREQKTPFSDERLRRNSSPPGPGAIGLPRSNSSSNFPPSSPSQRIRMDFPSFGLPPPPSATPQHPLSSFPMNEERKRFAPPGADLLGPFSSPSGSSPFLSSFFQMGGPSSISSLPLPMQSSSVSSPSSLTRRNGSVHSLANSDSLKSSLFPSGSSTNPFDFTRPQFLPPGPLPSMSASPFESDRYRFMFEQQARERDIQFAMMAAAAGSGHPGPGSLPPPPFFTDPNSSQLFKHF